MKPVQEINTATATKTGASAAKHPALWWNWWNQTNEAPRIEIHARLKANKK